MAKIRKGNNTAPNRKQKQKMKEESYSELRDASIEKVVENIHKQFGNDSIMLMTGAANCNVQVISSGSIKLDEALGVGGLPRGRIIEIYGREAGGKTTLGLSIIAEAQRISECNGDEKQVAIVEPECALNRSLIDSVGVNPSSLLLSQPDCGEEALEITQMLVESAKFSVVMVDSVAALVPREELYGEIGDTHIGAQARMMGQGLRKLSGAVKRSGTMLIFINQIRYKIGSLFGNPETTTGGNALKFFASIRLEINKGKVIKTGDKIIGHLATVKVVKNKLAPPYNEIRTEIIFGKGFNRTGEILDMASLYGITKESGSWISYKDERLGQGRNAVCAVLNSNPSLKEEIYNNVKIAMASDNSLGNKIGEQNQEEDEDEDD